MNLYPSQQSIVQRLKTDFTGLPFEAKDLPQSNAEYKIPVVNPVAYVVYSGSAADLTSANHVIGQERRVRFNVECYCRLLYGPNGFFALSDVVEQSLIGFKPTNCQRLYLLRDDVSQTDDESLWIHVYQFECVTMLIQKEDSDPIIIPEFKELIAKEE